MGILSESQVEQNQQWHDQHWHDWHEHPFPCSLLLLLATQMNSELKLKDCERTLLLLASNSHTCDFHRQLQILPAPISTYFTSHPGMLLKNFHPPLVLGCSKSPLTTMFWVVPFLTSLTLSTVRPKVSDVPSPLNWSTFLPTTAFTWTETLLILQSQGLIVCTTWLFHRTLPWQLLKATPSLQAHSNDKVNSFERMIGFGVGCWTGGLEQPQSGAGSGVGRGRMGS